ncbi:MAG TPA: hypothetical protein VF070_13200 [Streptosporangiaceae bacterium]
MTSEVIEQVAADAYRNGVPPLAFAIAVLEIVAEESFDLPCGDPRVRVMARRAAGAMLDCGWTPPGQPGGTQR